MIRPWILVLVLFSAQGCAAFNDPHVWAPVAAAVVLQVNDLDEQISDQLYENNPVFGDVENAKDWSDNFRQYTQTSYILAGAAADIPLDKKAFMLTAQYISKEALSEFRGELWRHIDRERPDGSNNNSMPSGHTTSASYQASLAKTNTQYLAVSDDTKRYLDMTYTSFAVMTGYARVEAGKHYPSDVLIGYALGAFAGNLAGMATDQALSIRPAINGVVVSYAF